MKRIWPGVPGALLIAAAAFGIFASRADNDAPSGEENTPIEVTDAFKSIVVRAGEPAEEYRINLRNLKIKSYDDSVHFYNGRLAVVVAQADLKGWGHDDVMIDEPLPPADEEKNPSDIDSEVKTIARGALTLTETAAGLRVSNAPESRMVDVFDIAGRHLGSQKVRNGEAEVNLGKEGIPSGRIVIVAVDGTPFKIKLKH